MSFNIGFAGLGAMGFGMACHLVNRSHEVTGYDVYEPSLAKFKAVGIETASSPCEAVSTEDYFTCMGPNALQADSVLFDLESGAVEALASHATAIAKLYKFSRPDIYLIDSSISGGTVKAGSGSLTKLASEDQAALEQGNIILVELSEKLLIIPGGIGGASNVKMVNQLLAGVHITAATEALALATRMGLNAHKVYDSIIEGQGNSWTLENRVPHTLDNNWHLHSALDTFLKDVVST